MGSDLQRRPSDESFSAALREAGQRISNASSVVMAGVLLAVTFQLAYQLLRTVIALPRNRGAGFPLPVPAFRRRPHATPVPLAPALPADTRPIHTGPFAAFHYRGFVINYFGSIFGVNGYFIYFTAQGWIALQLTSSAAGISLLFTISSVPMLFLTLFGGALADKVNRRWLVFFCRIAVFAIVTLMSLAAITGTMTIPVFVVLTLLLGVVWAIDLPARQSIIADVVPVAVLGNAFAWQSVIQFIGSTVGPVVAGYVVVAFGPGVALFIGGVGLTLVGVTMLFIGTTSTHHPSTESVPRRVWNGLRFIGSHEAILLLVLLASIPSITVLGIMPLMPIVARDILAGNAGTYGMLTAAIGVGSIVGSVVVAVTQHFKPKGWLATLATAAAGIGILCFAYTTTLPLALTFLLVYGAATGVAQTLTSTLVQVLTPSNYQGRVASIYMTTWNVTPIGIMAFGAVAQSTNVAFGIWASGISCIAITAILLASRPTLRNLRV